MTIGGILGPPGCRSGQGEFSDSYEQVQEEE